MADTKKFLDQQGTTYLWSKIKDQLDTKADASRVTIAEGTLTTVGGKVDTLVGSDTNKSVRTIANEELAAQLIPENAAANLNELQEIAAWIQAHPGDAATMNAAITALQNKLTLGYETGTTEYATVKAYVEAYAASLASNYATAAQGAKADTALQPTDIVALTDTEIDAAIAAASQTSGE